MLARPTTEQVLLDCCSELAEVVAGVDDPVLRARLAMVEGTLRTAAVRAAHETAWAQDETGPVREHVAAVLTAWPDPGLQELAGAALTGPVSLHLDDVVDAYVRTGDALARALEVAVERGDLALQQQGLALLRARADHERLVRGDQRSTAGR